MKRAEGSLAKLPAEEVSASEIRWISTGRLRLDREGSGGAADRKQSPRGGSIAGG
jgi:hypothetical protein